MKIFISNKSEDIEIVNNYINKLNLPSSFQIYFEKIVSKNWKENVINKLHKSDLILFFISELTFESEPLKWEFDQISSIEKPVFFIDLRNDSRKLPEYLKDKKIVTSEKELSNKIKEMNEQKNSLLLEQYKMMVTSTEKVTDQRLKVNNLFFTINTTLLSITILFGKSFKFTIFAIIGMLFFSTLSILILNFWSKLVISYGKLNEGKFRLINELEKELNTNMFKREWDILTNEVNYEPNTKTEGKIIKLFRNFIWVLFILEIVYLIYLLIIQYSCVLTTI